MTVAIVIPARLASTRLPEKLLLSETGKPLIEHTYRAIATCKGVNRVLIAVDDARMQRVVEGFGAEAVMTSVDWPSGTDRVAEVSRLFPDYEILVNVQGDEPEISHSAIETVANLLEQHPTADIATLATPIQDRNRFIDPSVVKVVRNHDGAALYFSRGQIPYPRDGFMQPEQGQSSEFLQHLGVYAYRREFLMRLNEVPKSPLENLEKLEQLRFLQNGSLIMVGIVDHAPKGIDTRQDYDAFVARVLSREG